ncbi:hypothetical protein AYK24_04765 [Thermoplasmatales archaeon SG8-52-4]|nr:MAG: hypothetical protein AYK24_04765 [Thermoplasmatales archaeon SG8-52-4]
MNQFMNPIFLFRILKGHLIDVNRIWRNDIDQLRRYQDKSIRKIVNYAYTVPLYHKKYKEYNVHPDDIKGIKDIHKLPLISKEDIRDNYPDGIIPKGYNKEKDFILSTSGSTGKPLFIYCDLYTIIRYTEGFVRTLKAYGGNWRKTKILLIIDMKPGSIEHAAFTSSISPFIKKFVPMNNLKYLHVGEKSESLIKQINEFNPEILGSDPPVLMKMAFLKNQGLGKDINLKSLFSAGSMLDKYTRLYVEKAFNAKILDTYGTTEAGPVAFENPEGDGYHVHSDFVYMEFLDDDQKPVPYGKPGHLAITRLYGKGTPIIRYTGLEDLITPIEPRTYNGMTTEMIKYIGGRSLELIHTPDGRMISPFHVTTIPASVMNDFNSYKINQFQIIQHKVDKIEVKVIIDEKLRNIGPSVKEILDEIIKRFQDVTSKDVEIVINEVDEIEKDVRLDLVRLVVTKLKRP